MCSTVNFYHTVQPIFSGSSPFPMKKKNLHIIKIFVKAVARVLSRSYLVMFKTFLEDVTTFFF